MFDNEFPPLGGGTGVVNYHLFQQFAQHADVVVDLVTSSRDRRAYLRERFSDRITLYKVPVDNGNIHHATNLELLRYAWRGIWQAERLQKQFRYDLSFAFAGVPAGAMSYWFSIRTGLPYLVSLQGPDVPGFEARYNYLYPLLKPLLCRIWRRAGAVTAISQEQCELAYQTLPELSLTVIPNGVDTSEFTPAEGGHERSEVLILCVARLIARKGQEYLLRALARLRRETAVAVRVVLVGSGDGEEALRALVRALDIQDVVTFRGAVDRASMPAMYQESDIFVLPSEQEGMSIALLEAMASGLPVVVTDTGGTTELVSPNVNGEIVRWADVEGLSDALHRLVENAGRRRAWGRASREKALAFGWPKLAERYLSLCRMVAGLPVSGAAESQAAATAPAAVSGCGGSGEP